MAKGGAAEDGLSLKDKAIRDIRSLRTLLKALLLQGATWSSCVIMLGYGLYQWGEEVAQHHRVPWGDKEALAAIQDIRLAEGMKPILDDFYTTQSLKQRHQKAIAVSSEWLSHWPSKEWVMSQVGEDHDLALLSKKTPLRYCKQWVKEAFLSGEFKAIKLNDHLYQPVGGNASLKQAQDACQEEFDQGRTINLLLIGI